MHRDTEELTAFRTFVDSCGRTRQLAMLEPSWSTFANSARKVIMFHQATYVPRAALFQT
jgi:hypothetical protein